MKFTIQQNILGFQVMVQQWRIHIVQIVYSQSNFIKNAESQAPGNVRIYIFLPR